MPLINDELNLLLYLESGATDFGGLFDCRRINSVEYEILTRWNENGFVKSGRLSSTSLPKPESKNQFTHWCELSEEAWTLAHAERKNKCQRLFAKRTWQKSTE